MPGAGRLRVDRRWGRGTPDAGHATGRPRPRPAGHPDLNPETGEECPRAVFNGKGGCSTPKRPSGRWSARPEVPASRGTGATTRPRRPGCATAGTGRAISATGTRTTSSTSAGATSTGCGSTARTSPPRRWKCILQRHPDVVLASVYAVPDTVVGDQVMATLLLHHGTAFDPEGFAKFLAGEADIGNQMGAPLRPDQPTELPVRRPPRSSSGSCATKDGGARTRCGGDPRRVRPTAAWSTSMPTRWTRPSPSVTRGEPEAPDERIAVGIRWLAGSGLSLLSPDPSRARSPSTSADGDSLQAGVTWQLGRDRADEAERARRLNGEGIEQVTTASLDVEVAAVGGRCQVDGPDVR